MKNKIVQTIQEYVIIALGCTIMAAGVSLFLLPNELSTGGFSGIATIVYYFFKVPMGVTVLALNIPLLIIAYFKVGKQLFARSIYGTIVFSLMIDLIDKITPLILKFDASTGGSDLLSHIIRAYKKQYKSSSLILSVDTVVIALNVIFFKNIEIGLYSAIAIFLMGKMIDLIFEGVNFTKVIFIISPKYEEIAGQISASINRGSTGLFSKGMYTDQEKLTLLCVGSRTEAYEMQSIAKDIDADGVHVGQSDMEAMDVRKILGPDKILGVSAQTVEQAIIAEKHGADYLGVGAVFTTGSKDDADDVSHETLKAICEAVSIPVIAIGGITKDNVAELAGSGICGVAVISAIFGQKDIQKATEELKFSVENMLDA